ncbi:class I SAM-dependent methyltransferase [Ktedonobacteria bacterium brp13]|nr:class I SAM-dependent methyltransferase [Ktedonobacteria bacterium brp13]
MAAMASRQQEWWDTLITIVEQLNNADIDYTVIEEAAYYAQGAAIPQPSLIEFSVQWDLFARAYDLFQCSSSLEEHIDYPIYQRCQFQSGPYTIALRCYPNTVVSTDPMRYLLTYDETQIWVKALDAYLKILDKADPARLAIVEHLATLQQQNNQHNQQVWNQDTYDAWLQRHGKPEDIAARLRKDPLNRLSSLAKYGTAYSGKKVINLLGSHGLKAIALALLDANVTIVDIAQENAQYAREVAQAAGVTIRYIVSDVLSLPQAEQDGSYDLVFMEMGILHYFVNLEPLAHLVHQLLQSGGQLILQDFHPISTKLITSKGKKHKVSGNYFDPTLITSNVAFSKHLTGQQQSEDRYVYEREWTLGEIVTAFAQAGLIIDSLEEEPNMKRDDIGLPKTFTLVAHHP